MKKISNRLEKIWDYISVTLFGNQTNIFRP